MLRMVASVLLVLATGVACWLPTDVGCCTRALLATGWVCRGRQWWLVGSAGAGGVMCIAVAGAVNVIVVAAAAAAATAAAAALHVPYTRLVACAAEC